MRGGFLGIDYSGRHVMLQVSSFGVSPSLLETRMNGTDPTVTATELCGITNALAPHTAAAASTAPPYSAVTSGGQGSALQPPVVIAAVDLLERLKGVQLKLLAWEALLRDYPKYRVGHILLQAFHAIATHSPFTHSPFPPYHPSVHIPPSRRPGRRRHTHDQPHERPYAPHVRPSRHTPSLHFHAAPGTHLRHSCVGHDHLQ